MHTARLLAACLAAALTACGGGGDDAAPGPEIYLQYSKAGAAIGGSRVGDCAKMRASLAQWDGSQGITITCVVTFPTLAPMWGGGAEVDSVRFVFQASGQASCVDITNWLSGPAYVYASCRAL